MKKSINLLLLLAAMLLPMTMRAQGTLLVADGTSTSSYVPFYGLWADEDQHEQIIYSSSLLGDMIGNSISSVTFFASSTSTALSSGSFVISLGTTTETSFSSSYLPTTDFEEVYSGQLSYTGTQLIIEFETPFTYSGGNLVIDIAFTSVGDYNSCDWFGENQSDNVSAYAYGGDSPTTSSFLPKTEFAYGSSICRKPRNIVVSDLASDGATLTWTGHEDHSGYTLMYHTADFDPATSEDALSVTTTDTTYTFSGLDASTTYYVKVKADCSDGGESGWTSATTFHTLCEGGGCVLEIQMADSWGDGWNGNAINVTVGGTQVESATISSGSSNTYTYNMCGTDNVVLTWVSGSYPSETSFDISVGGALMLSAGGSNYSTGDVLLNITGCPACPAPSNIVVSNVTSDGADISWTANGDETQWAIKIGENDWETANDTVYTATSLESNTVYNVIVRALCDDGDSSYATYGSFRTACGGSTTVPYSTNFDNDNDGEAPACWLAVQTGTSGSGTFPSVYNYSSNSYSSPKYFEFESTSGETEIVALPVMDNISSLSLSFYASVMNTNFVLEVGVMEGSDFVTVDTVNLVAGSGSDWHNSYYPYTVYFSNYSGDGDRIAMRVTATGSYTLMMDDFTVEEFFGCYPVSDLVARNIDSTEITLAWADELNGGVPCNVYYWTNGGDTLVETASDTTITLTNLNANTLYNIAVRANCADGEASAVNASFRTACGTVAIPYIEDFESYETTVPPACWTQLNGNPRVQSSYPHNGSKHLYFSGAQPNTIALPPMNMPTNELQVRFWTRPENYTSSSCGTFSVGYMTDITVDSTFVELANWSYDEFSAYEEKEVPMVGAPDDAIIVLRHNSNANNYYWYVDDLVVEVIPSCARPTSVSVSNVTSTDADINILGVDGAAYRIFWSDGTTTDSADVTGDSYSLSGLTGSTNYVVSVSTICDDGTLTTPVNTTFKTACEAGSCDLVINMEDGFGDGWNGASIDGFINNEEVFSATFSSGSNASFTYSLCASDSIVLRWMSGLYDDEASFEITVGGSVIASGNGDDYNNYGIIATHQGCPTCGAPNGFAIDSLSADAVTFHWNTNPETSEWIVIFNGDNTNATTVNTNSMTFTGLVPNTQYTVTISTVCSEEEISFPLNASFRTACGAITTLPWSEDFNSFTSTTSATVIPCWDYIGSGGYVDFSSSYSHSGNCVRFHPNGSSTSDHILVLPVFADDISTLAMSFWTRPESVNYSGSLSVGYLTNPAQDSTFVEVLNIPASMGTENIQYETLFTGAPAGSRIAMRHNVNSSYYYWFVDDIEVFVAPSCPHPVGVAATDVSSDNITIAFAGSPSGNYVISISDSANLNNTVNITGDSTYTFTGLTPLTNYYISVSTDCGTEVSTSVDIVVSTSMVAVDLPYSTGFEAGQDVAWMLENGSQVNQWVIDSAANNGGSNALYISNDNGASNAYSNSSASNVYAYKLFTLADSGDYAISYDWRANGESCCDYLRVFLVPSTVSFVAGSTTNISTTGAPTGWIALDGESKLNVSSSWQNRMEIVHVSTPGEYNLLFFWHNDGSVGSNPPAAIDNVQIGMLSCSAPQNIVIDDITSSSASISWTPAGGETEWEVAFNGTSTIVNTPSFTLTNLSAMSAYSVSVRAICGEGDTSFATFANFTSGLCDNMIAMENFDTTMTSANSSYSPIGYSYYNYSYVQIIIPASSMDANGTEITALSFLPASTSAGSYFTNMDVYMANVSENEFTDFIHPDSAHTFVQVINSGNFNYNSTDWQLHAFDTPFTWDGQSNVLVAINRRHGSYSSGAQFKAHTDSLYRTIYDYTDNGAFDINTADDGTTSHTVGNLRLISCGEGCAAPIMGNVVVTSEDVTVNFNADGTVEAAIVEGDNFTATSGTVVTGNTYTFTGLTPATTYTFGLRNLCENGSASMWVTRTVTTDSAVCFVPTNVTVSATTFDGAAITWTAGGEETAWEVRVYNNTYDQTFNANTNSLTVTGLNEGTFNVSVRALCSATNTSEWSEPIQFTTESCMAPTNVAVSSITANSATVSWTAAASSNGRYTMEYGFSGFSRGQGTTVEVTGTTYTITGLESEIEYDVYVASYCGENIVSPWTPVQSFTTVAGGQEETYTITVQSNNTAWGTVTGGGTYPAGTQVTLTATATSIGEFVEWQDGNTEAQRSIVVTGNATYTATFREKVGIDDVDGNAIALYPNPASTTVTIAGMELQSQIVIVDMNGREVYRANAADGSVKVDVSNLSKGAYFVRITGEKTNAIRKLVVK